MLVAALYGVVAVWWLWPLPRHIHTAAAYFSNDFPLVVADYYLIVWAMAWDAHALVTTPWDLFHANAFHPSVDALAYSEHFLGYLPLFAPTFWITGNAILAANAMILATYVLAGLATYLLARRFVERPAALLAGFFFAFYPGRFDVQSHIHLLGAFWIPLAMLATERGLDQARWRDAALLVVALTMQALSSFYLAFALGIAYLPYLALALWRWRARLDRRRALGLLAVFALAGVVVGASGIPYIRLRRLGLIPTYDAADDTAGPLGLTGLGGLRVWYFLARQSVGPVGWVLAAIALLPPWRRGNGARRTALAVAVVGTLASFGTGIPIGGPRSLWTPYALLVRWIPGASTIRQPARFVVVAQLGLALLAGLGFARLFSGARRRYARPAAAVLAALALVTFRPLPQPPLIPEPTGERVAPAYRWLAEHGEGRPLLEEPAANSAESARRMYLSTVHWLPIVDGYSGYPPASASYLHRLAFTLPQEEALQSLVDTVDIGWILVHRDQMPAERAARWNVPLPDGLERVAAWGDDLLVRVTRAPRDDRRARLLSTRETLGGVPLAPLGARCPGRIVVRSVPASPWAASPENTWLPLATAHLEIDVRNDGSVAWPAFGFVPRHLVRLAACLSRVGALPCTDKPTALPADVPAGAVVPTNVDLRIPRLPGSYTLDLSLVQVGDGPLDRCGVAPLRLPLEIGPPAARPPS